MVAKADRPPKRKKLGFGMPESIKFRGLTYYMSPGSPPITMAGAKKRGKRLIREGHKVRLVRGATNVFVYTRPAVSPSTVIR